MTKTYTCDHCGRTIDDDDPIVTLSADTSADSRWTGGWLGHYHDDCYRSIFDLLKLARDFSPSIEHIPVATESDIRARRRAHTLVVSDDPDDQLVQDLDLAPRVKNALGRAGITRLGDLRRRVEDDTIQMVPRLGEKSIGEIIELAYRTGDREVSR